MERFKQKGEVIRDTYEVLNAFPFVEGVLYFTAVKDNREDPSVSPVSYTRFIHAIEMDRELEKQEMVSLLSRNPDVFFPIKEVFMEDGWLYHVFEKMEGSLLGIYLLQSAPLSLPEASAILKNMIGHLIQCRGEAQFALVDPQNIVISQTGQVRFLYGGPVKLLNHPHEEAEDVKQIANLLYTMLTNEKLESLSAVRSLRKDIPLELENLLTRALSPDKSKRPSLDDFWKWLQRNEMKKPKAISDNEKSKLDDSLDTLSDQSNPKSSFTTTSEKPKKLSSENPPYEIAKKFSRRPLLIGALAIVVLALTFMIGQFLFQEPTNEMLAGIIDPHIEQDEEMALSYFMQSTLAYDDKKLDQSIEFARKALSADPEKKEYYQHLANLYGRIHDYKKGKQTLEAAVIQFPDTASLYDSLAVFAYYLKDYNRAKEAIDTALKLDGQNDHYHYHQGKIYGAMKKYEEAKQSINKAIFLSGQARYYHDLATYLEKTNQLDEAIKQAKKAVSISPKNEKYHLTLGVLYLKKYEQVYKNLSLDSEKRNKELLSLSKSAASALDKAVKIESNYAEACYYRAIAYYYSNNLEKALFSAKRAVKLDSKNALYQYQLGMTYMALKQKADAINAFQKATQLDGSNAVYDQALVKVKALPENQSKSDKDGDHENAKKP